MDVENAAKELEKLKKSLANRKNVCVEDIREVIEEAAIQLEHLKRLKPSAQTQLYHTIATDLHHTTRKVQIFAYLLHEITSLEKKEILLRVKFPPNP